MSDDSKKDNGKKKSIYMSEQTSKEIEEISARLDRSFSWTVAKAFELAKDQLAKLPSDVG